LIFIVGAIKRLSIQAFVDSFLLFFLRIFSWNKKVSKKRKKIHSKIKKLFSLTFLIGKPESIRCLVFFCEFEKQNSDKNEPESKRPFHDQINLQ
jgi:hypothetical protein